MSEIERYVSARGQRLEISDMMRYAVAVLVPLFAVGAHGWVSRTPGRDHRSWAILGLMGTAAACYIGGVGVVSVLDGGWAQAPWLLATILFAAWVAATSVVMIRSS